LGLAADDVDFVPVTTPTREAFLEQDKVDIILAAYTITPEREKVVDFAGPYYESPSALLVPKGNPKSIHSMSDMVGKKLCLPSGGAQETTVREKFPKVAKNLVLFDS